MGATSISHQNSESWRAVFFGEPCGAVQEPWRAVFLASRGDWDKIANAGELFFASRAERCKSRGELFASRGDWMK